MILLIVFIENVWTCTEKKHRICRPGCAMQLIKLMRP